MRLIGNALNGDYFRNLLSEADSEDLVSIRLAVAYVRQMDDVFELARRRKVPLDLYCLFDVDFPSKPILKRFVDRHSSLNWRLFLTANFYHPKIYWFEGIGAYIGSANLTGQGWNNNLECGVWFDQVDIDREGIDEQLRPMFTVIRGRSTPASDEHVALIERLEHERQDFQKAKSAFAKAVDAALVNIPGRQAPIDVTQRDTPGGAARRAFVAEWNETLTILRKLTELARKRPRPSWVSADVHPTIIQDQATEYWYNQQVRATRESETEIERLHQQNRGKMGAAVEVVFADWARSDITDEFWIDWTNEEPKRLMMLLSQANLREWDREKMLKLVWGGHASREHARQMSNATVGLEQGENRGRWERSVLFADYLMKQRTADGKAIAAVLEFVLWGDAQMPDCADRLWLATQDPNWKISHLGINILGEWIGYARPGDFPPRNNRVSKCLYALGYEGVWH